MKFGKSCDHSRQTAQFNIIRTDFTMDLGARTVCEILQFGFDIPFSKSLTGVFSTGNRRWYSSFSHHRRDTNAVHHFP